jgi:NTE family protein
MLGISRNQDNIENVLIFQGGGSLGAFGCGVFKGFTNSDVEVDIIAGTSIGGINAAILAGSKDEHPERALEQFWLEIAENSIDFISVWRWLNPYLQWQMQQGKNYYPLSSTHNRFSTNEVNEQLKNTLSFYSSAMYGNSKMFLPRWRSEHAITDPQFFRPDSWTYIYDHSPLAKTLEKYIDYNKLKPGGNPKTRLIITAVNVLTAEPLTFDSSRQQITVKHLLGTSGYPLYGFPWVEVEKELYAWDGSLLSNTPLREVIDASPVRDKRVFIVENYPKKIEILPQNMPEVYHRARDIMFSDKTAHNVRMSKVITQYLRFIDELYQLVEKHVSIKNLSELDQIELDKTRKKYKRMTQDRGAEIKTIAHITREEPFPYLYENTDFTLETIRELIAEGESKTMRILRDRGLAK